MRKEDFHDRFSQSDLLHIAEFQEEVYALKKLSDKDPPPSRLHYLLLERFGRAIFSCQITNSAPRPFAFGHQSFALVIQHERQINTANQQILATTIDPRRPLYSQGRGLASTGTGRRSNSSELYTYCGRQGHTIDACYGKHGYPPGHPRYPSKPRFNGKGTASINSAITPPSSSSSQVQKEMVASSSLSDPVLNLSPTQHKALLA
ncbi:uncharacterized protein LOC127746565 [Arachis duranensis]|uniref:Uncharacterized protein LOC127741668 n=1 Tax=Arachis duranensis TaxID=130453 RepID=A0A9C6T651_ARADU|nr:uncharacterized protein LOC127741668 [Arachis duranensis]XP_052116167.1 uncharacterized protein LOC127746565 [Arachis duranensis]